MSETEFTIGQLARETGCKIPTIRYYEKIGFIPVAQRSAGNTRLYGPAHIDRLRFIQHCRQLGFSQPATRELLNMTDRPDQSCETVTEIARARLDDVNNRITRLVALKSELECMIAACDGGRVEQCRIVEALADYSPDYSETSNA